MEKLSDEQLVNINGGMSELAATSLKALGKMFMDFISSKQDKSEEHKQSRPDMNA